MAQKADDDGPVDMPAWSTNVDFNISQIYVLVSLSSAPLP